jgi:hypothetical protein
MSGVTIASARTLTAVRAAAGLHLGFLKEIT